MTKYFHRRQGAPFALVKDTALPADILTGYGGVTTEVAAVGAIASAVSGANVIAPSQPASAKQVLRWHFGITETGNSPNFVTDHSPTGLAGLSYTTGGAGSAMTYSTHDGSPTGAYGASFYGGDAEARRCVVGTIAKLSAATKIRFVAAVFPRVWTDRPFGQLFRLADSLPSGTPRILIDRYPDGSLRVTQGAEVVTFANVFANDVMQLIEVQIDGFRVAAWKDGALIGRGAFTTPSTIGSNPAISIGNQSAGGRSFTGYVGYAAIYIGDLSEAELAWIRDDAKTIVDARPGGLNDLADAPEPKPTDHLRFSVLPDTSPSSLQTVGGIVNMLPGRAVDGLGGPIALSYRVLFGATPGAGTDITPTDLTVKPSVAGYLTFEVTADNGVHPAVVQTKVLPVATSYPALTAANVESRLSVPAGVYIDNYDAGFPADTVWKPENVCDPGDGTVGLRIIKNSAPGRVNTGGSLQMLFSPHSGSTGVAAQLFRVEFVMQLIDTRGPGMAKGYVQTGFTFTSPYTAKRRELDFEFNSLSGLMECTIHLEPNDGGGSVAQGIHIEPPAGAFTAQRTWTITSNADRIEWAYEGTVCARYIRGNGWDSTVQAFTPRKSDGTLFNNGDTLIHPRDAGWHLNAQKAFIQQWMSDQHTAWIGPNTVPIDHPLFRVSNVNAQEFGATNTALQSGDWTAVAGGAGEIVVNVASWRPAGFGFIPTHLEYSIDGGGWTRLAGTTGNQTITGLTAGSRAVRLRPVAESLATNPAVTASNYTLNANTSDTKNVTVT